MYATTAEHLAYHAAFRPRAIALVEDGAAVPFARFHADLNRFARRLGGFGLARGAIVAVECADTYLHWLQLLACEVQGLVSASFAAAELPPPAALLARADLILHRAPLPTPPRGQARRLDADYIAEAMREPPEPPDLPPLRPGDGQRIRRSSGTTGSPKMMLSTRGEEEAGLRSHAYLGAPGQASRTLVFNHFAIGANHAGVTAALRAGGTVIVERRSRPVEALVRYRPTHLRALVGEAAALLDALPPEFARPASLVLYTGGSALSDALRARLLARLATEIVVTYSTNEAHRVGLVGPGGIVAAAPGVEVEIVDEAGAPAPAGMVGELRVRGEGVVAGYLDDPEATAQRFRDGWFQPGDLAERLGPRRFRLAGRRDGMIQLGTGKVLPGEIEELILATGMVAEVAVTALRDESGIDRLCAALVPPPGAAGGLDVQALAARLPAHLGGIRFAVMTALPRNQAGKVELAALRRLFASHA